MDDLLVHFPFSKTQCAVFKGDRLEVTSLGGLYNGLLTPRFQVFDDMFRVDLFRSTFSIEDQKSIEEASEKSRKSIGEESEKHRRRIKKASEDHPNNSRDNLNSTQKQILELLSQDTRLSAKKIAGAIGISSRNIESNIKKLKRRGILIRHGSPKNGYWEITDRT